MQIQTKSSSKYHQTWGRTPNSGTPNSACDSVDWIDDRGNVVNLENGVFSGPTATSDWVEIRKIPVQ